MRNALFPASFLLIAAAEAPFEPSTETFASAAACTARLASFAGSARASGYDAVEGPYDVGPADVRIHMVKAEGTGHRISEHRCLAEQLGSRSWTHSMEQDQPEFTVESVARSAPWLNKRGAEQ